MSIIANYAIYCEHDTTDDVSQTQKCFLKNDISIEENTCLDLARLFRYVVKNGVDWDIMEFIIEFDDEMKRQITKKNEHTGLYPFMEVAMVSKRSLKTLYNITMNSDLGLLFPV